MYMTCEPGDAPGSNGQATACGLAVVDVEFRAGAERVHASPRERLACQRRIAEERRAVPKARERHRVARFDAESKRSVQRLLTRGRSGERRNLSRIPAARNLIRSGRV